MSELPPDLPRLRTLETWLQLTLDEVRKHISRAEQQAARESPTAPPPPPDWVVQLSVGRDANPVALHVGDCNAAGRHPRPIARDQAIRALTDGLEPCPICRPETGLGIL